MSTRPSRLPNHPAPSPSPTRRRRGRRSPEESRSGRRGVAGRGGGRPPRTFRKARAFRTSGRPAERRSPRRRAGRRSGSVSTFVSRAAGFYNRPKPTMRKRRPDFDLTPREILFLSRLTPPWRIQRFLDELEYDSKGEGCRSARRVLSERRVQCMDGALFAAAALRVQGHRPLVLDLEAVYDDDHVLALFRGNVGWGAIARSNYSGLRFREAIHPTIRSLVLSYFENYFNLR